MSHSWRGKPPPVEITDFAGVISFNSWHSCSIFPSPSSASERLSLITLSNWSLSTKAHTLLHNKQSHKECIRSFWFTYTLPSPPVEYESHTDRKITYLCCSLGSPNFEQNMHIFRAQYIVKYVGFMNKRGVVCNQDFLQLSHWHFPLRRPSTSFSLKIS